MQGTQYAPRESILCMEHFVALQSLATCRERIIKSLIRLRSLVCAFIVSHAAKSGLFRDEANVHSRYDLRCSKRKRSVTRSAKPTTRIAV